MNMTTLMQKTKRELIEFIQEMEGSLGRMEAVNTRLEGEKHQL